MGKQELIDEEMARILDILEQIKSVNKMINFHKYESRDSSMVHQYEDIRRRFLVELKEILQGFGIEVVLPDKTA